MNRLKAAELLSRISGRSHQVSAVQRAHGGCISTSWIVTTGKESYFLKQCDRNHKDLLKAEITGLKELSQCKELKTPAVLGIGEYNDDTYLMLEALDLHSHHHVSEQNLAYGLAALHRIQAQKYGFEHNNYIGSTRQVNDKCDSWVDFFINCRLRPQAKMTGHDEIGTKVAELSQKIPEFFTDYTPLPSLLHGDLWSGNTARLRDDTAVIFDPAVYYGDRETDLAFTEFFGGFSASFYTAYNRSWPLHAGYKTRKHLYQLYHSLNHLNLFGDAYLKSSLSLINALIKIKY